MLCIICLTSEALATPRDTFSSTRLTEFTADAAFNRFPLIKSEICLAAELLSSASFLISSSTTLNPLPASPAREASITAFRSSRFVCADIPDIIAIISPSLDASTILCYS